MVPGVMYHDVKSCMLLSYLPIFIPNYITRRYRTETNAIIIIINFITLKHHFVLIECMREIDLYMLF
jgi:hypothetical protein